MRSALAAAVPRARSVSAHLAALPMPICLPAIITFAARPLTTASAAKPATTASASQRRQAPAATGASPAAVAHRALRRVDSVAAFGALLAREPECRAALRDDLAVAARKLFELLKREASVGGGGLDPGAGNGEAAAAILRSLLRGLAKALDRDGWRAVGSVRASPHAAPDSDVSEALFGPRAADAVPAATGVGGDERPHRPHWRPMLRAGELVGLSVCLSSARVASAELFELIAARLLDFGLYRTVPAGEAAAALTAMAAAQADGVVLGACAQRLAAALAPALSQRLGAMDARRLCELLAALHALRGGGLGVGPPLFARLGALLGAQLGRAATQRLPPPPAALAGALEALGCAGLRSRRLAAARSQGAVLDGSDAVEAALARGVRAAAAVADGAALCALAKAASRFGLMLPCGVVGSDGVDDGDRTEVEPLWAAIEDRAAVLLPGLDGRQVASLASSFAKAARVFAAEQRAREAGVAEAGRLRRGAVARGSSCNASADAAAQQALAPARPPLRTVGSASLWASLCTAACSLVHSLGLPEVVAMHDAVMRAGYAASEPALISALSGRVAELVAPPMPRRLAAAVVSTGGATALKPPSRPLPSPRNISRSGRLQRADLHAKAACVLFAALEPHSLRSQRLPAAGPAAAVATPPPAEAVAALLSSVARDLFESIPPLPTELQAAASPAASRAAVLPEPAALAVGLTPAAQQAISAGHAAALEHVADLLRMGMLTAGVLPARVGGVRVPSASGLAVPLLLPLRQLAVAAALALGALPDVALARMDLQALASLIAAFAAAEDEWPLLAGTTTAATSSPERDILSAAGARLRHTLACARGIPRAAQLAALQRLPLVYVSPRLAERALGDDMTASIGSFPSQSPRHASCATVVSASNAATRVLRPESTVGHGMAAWGFE